MATECKIDRLSALPDSILACNIFSYLSLRDVVRTSLLSTRWTSLWKQIPHLHFSQDFFQPLMSSLGIETRWYMNYNLKQKVKCLRFYSSRIENQVQKMRCLNDIIDNILLLHSGHIERFSLHVTISERLRVEQWIHHAALKEVKHMSLKVSSLDLKIPPTLFACHLLRDLELKGFRFTEIPTDFDGFPSLKSCSLSYLQSLRDDGLNQFLGLCPLLHKLKLECCYELFNLKIRSPNLNSLNIRRCSNMKSLTADCPQLVELEIGDCKKLSEFKMNSCVLNSLRKLSVKALHISSGFALLALGCFHNLEEVHIEKVRIKKKNGSEQIWEENHLEQERAKGEVEAGLNFPSLKEAYVDISSKMTNEEEIQLEFLLNNAPSLNTITVSLPYCPAKFHDQEFIWKVEGLRRIHEKVDIRMNIDFDRIDAVCILNEDEKLKDHITDRFDP